MNKNILTDAEISHLFSHFRDTQDTFIQRVMKALPDLVYVMNLDDHTIIYSSKYMAHEIGYSIEEIRLMEHSIFDIMHPADKEMFIKHLDDVKKSIPGEVLAIEYRLIRKDGKIAWFIDRNTLFSSTNREAPTKIGISHQITQRKEYEQNLIKKEKIMQQSEILAEIGSWEYDCPTKRFTWSDGMYRLFGLPLGTRVRPSIYMEFCTKDNMPIAVRIVESIENNNKSFEEILQITVNGGVRILKIKADPVLDTIGSKQFVGVDQDITTTEKHREELKTLNKELSDKNKDIELMHHDLKTFSEVTSSNYKTSLKQIYTAFEVFLTNEAANVSDHGKGALRRIQALIQRTNLLTDDIHSYLTIGRSNEAMKNVSIDEILTNILHGLKPVIEEKNVLLKKDKIGSIVGDVHLLHILFKHLIENAIKFGKTDQQTIITISSNVSEPSGNTNDGTSRVNVSIEDNGSGFSEEEAAEIFELFYKNHRDRKLKGSGVGLAIARKIMSIHGGLIIAESKVNVGSKFTCVFPLPLDKSRD